MIWLKGFKHTTKDINHLISPENLFMMDIDADLLQWLIFFDKKSSGSGKRSYAKQRIK